MEYFWKNVWRGFVVITPFLATFFIAFWLLALLERLMGGVLRHLFPFYIPGMGIIGAVLLLYLAGRFMDKDRPGFKLIGLAGRQMERTPYVKTLYSGIRDLIRSISMLGERGRNAKQVVLVRLGNDASLLGLVTSDRVPAVSEACSDETVVAVYIPFSYQMGGFTVFLPPRLLQKVDMTVPQAMEIILSAAMATGRSAEE